MTSNEGSIRGWLTGRVPAEWFVEPLEVAVDKDEILVVGAIGEPDLAPDADDAERSAAALGRISAFREQTRAQRIQIARELQHRAERTVSWGARCGDQRVLFTTASVPVMTRLRMSERQTLDTLVDAGVARSRSDALAWCVRLVATNSEDWLSDLREALTAVEKVRAAGP